ncbi:pyrroloquinoline quinone biosynthesis peptide chaperone PqqD [Litoreibacter roseus]|uniref:Coenzyme PQQ synthesis protein D n=1 Tax=Litoreibacter roseus TaxID=2601869 RepID=A0A6N6JJA0_9RHOB|nr:pyrroloquinoline quinone biosynthesis peptide chaperone PqqD [Litoreibacter roseus]GFE66356.1 coenzyme PQQ synthesis protein D [Litoreibacter roseus]
MTLEANDVPVMPRGVRLHFDKVRDRWVLLAPERTISLDEIALAIHREIDGIRNFEAIVARLAETYEAPTAEIAEDVSAYIAGLADRRFLDIAR